MIGFCQDIKAPRLLPQVLPASSAWLSGLKTLQENGALITEVNELRRMLNMPCVTPGHTRPHSAEALPAPQPSVSPDIRVMESALVAMLRREVEALRDDASTMSRELAVR